MIVKSYGTIDELPPGAIGLLDAAAMTHVESSPGWFANMQRTVFKNESGVRYYVAETDGVAVAVIPLRHVRTRLINQIESLANYYTSIYAPPLPGADPQDAFRKVVGFAEHALGRANVIRLAPMDPDSIAYAGAVSGLRSAGWVPFRFFCFGNWYLQSHGGWREYLSARAGALRSNLKRKGRRFAEQGGALEVIADRSRLAMAIRDYSAVYAKSWKRPEPYPEFIPGLMTWLADNAMLRVGIARLDGHPVAAQLWIVSNEKASIFKLAHDKEYDEQGVGTLLTGRMMEHVMEEDGVSEVDYLIGDEAHKQLWMNLRRERWGVVAYNPRTIVGALLLAKEVTGRALKGASLMQYKNKNRHSSGSAVWVVVPTRDFEEYWARWDALQSSTTGTPFLESGFLKPALAEFGTGKEVLAFAEQDGEWQAAAILVRSRLGVWQTFQPSQLPLGAWIAGRNFLRAETLGSLIAALPGFALAVSITQQDPALQQRPLDGPQLCTLDYVQTAWVDIDQPFDAYWDGRGKNLKTNCRKQRTKLESEGVANSLECLRDPVFVADALRDYGELESQGWKGKDGTAVHPDNAQGRFYRSMLENFCKFGRGRIYRYRLNEKVVAMDLCIESAERIVILKTAYDESYKTISPSTLMRQDEFRDLFSDARLKRIEFYGKVMDWHTRWTTNARMVYHVSCYRWRSLARIHRYLRRERRQPERPLAAE